MKLVLASASPRRKEILELLGLKFEVAESLFDEDLVKADDTEELVEELALQKALAVAARYPDTVIVGGDTTVDLEGESLGKAGSKEVARELFGKLLGKTHRVVTGVAVVNSLTGESYSGSEVGEVAFREGSERELEEYVNEEKNWRGFAGAYALQGGAAPFVLSQTGKLSAIIGLPVELTCALLEQAGVVVDEDAMRVEEMLVGMRVGLG